MQSVVYVYKPRCLTPLQTIKLFTRQFPEYANQKIGYAGRLDPMAEGILILLIGEENKHRHTYEHLPKTYHVDILPGFTTDTYDILGLVTDYKETLKVSVIEDITQRISLLQGVYYQSFPPYSSHPVHGKPLFWWARNNLIGTITLPQKPITIIDASVEKIKTISREQAQRLITDDVLKVQGDFRQKEILSRWNEIFLKIHTKAYPLLRGKITCSSGTYIRSLIHEIGRGVDCGAIALRIIRTEVGDIRLKNNHIVRILS